MNLVHSLKPCLAKTVKAREVKTLFVAFHVLRAVVMNDTIFLDVEDYKIPEHNTLLLLLTFLLLPLGA
jgi:hypothetical protein